MTLLVWVGWRLFQKGQSKPASSSFVFAILISAFVFGVGHLPVAIMLGETGAAVVLFVIVANSAFGIVAGYLYWKYGLESAMIAHVLGHVILAAASYAGAYF
jgi:membrane protease YdiL (CAAX protease family)